MAVDQFGITMLNATKSGAREWFNKWGNGHTRVMKRTGNTSYLLPLQTNATEYNVDPDDPELMEMADGPAYWFIDGAGTATHATGRGSGSSLEGGAYGNDIRLTICDLPVGENPYDIGTLSPARKKWTNVEFTGYVRWFSEAFNPPQNGAIRLAARSNHFNYKYCLCDAGGYDFQLYRNSAAALGVSPTEIAYLRVDKEMIHDTYGNRKYGFSHFTTGPGPYYKGQTPTAEGGYTFPPNRWVGMKLVLRTITSLGHVKIEGWWDLDNGLNGGNWVKLIEWTDTGVLNEWGATASGTKSTLDAFWADNGCGTPNQGLPNRCVDTAAPYLNYNPVYLRAGYACYFRVDQINKIQLKHFSIREIDPL